MNDSSVLGFSLRNPTLVAYNKKLWIIKGNDIFCEKANKDNKGGKECKDFQLQGEL